MMIYTAVVISLLTPLTLFLGRNFILNWIKTSFVKDVEKYKHDLDVQKEIIKQDINREAQKVAHLSTSKQSIYPELYEKLRVCEGSVGLLHGVRYMTDYQSLPNEEIKKIINKSKSPDTFKRELVELVELDRNNAIKKLQDEFARIEFMDARILCQETKNLLILKSLYFSKAVRDRSFETLSLLNGIVIDLDLYKQTNQMPVMKVTEDQKKIANLISDIEETMREEIFGEIR